MEKEKLSTFKKVKYRFENNNLECLYDSFSESTAANHLTLQDFHESMEVIRNWANYKATPLHKLSSLAHEVGVGQIYIKDEASRFGLKSFKALGGAYACQKLILEIINKNKSLNGEHDSLASPEDILDDTYRQAIGAITIACATDGNHGLSVAWGCKSFGANCVIYLHEDVSQAREDAIRAYGAKIVRVTGNYDASVIKADDDAKANGWYIVSDTSYDGYKDIPKNVMAGYGVLAQEIVDEISSDIRPSHVFLQGGVGGFAASMVAYFAHYYKDQMPKFIICEPELADCLFMSAKNKALTEINITEETLMAGLSCGSPSIIAWEILQELAHTFITLPETVVAPSMRLLAQPLNGDPSIEAGESAIAGLAAFLVAAYDESLRRNIGLDHNSTVLCISTEGATDPEMYKKLTS